MDCEKYSREMVRVRQTINDRTIFVQQQGQLMFIRNLAHKTTRTPVNTFYQLYYRYYRKQYEISVAL